MHDAVRVLLIAASWVLIHIGSGFLAHHLPLTWFQTDKLLFRSRRWERGGTTYRRYLALDRWKRHLPEAGSMFAGGFSKQFLATTDPDYLARFVAETRRAELSHWLPLPASLFFFLWNPFHVAVWMPVYAIVTNMPFVVVQRAVRPRLEKLHRRARERTRMNSQV